MVAFPSAFICMIQSLTQSTCCSIIPTYCSVRRLEGPVIVKIGEAVNRNAQITSWPVSPCICQLHTATANINAEQGSSHRIEASRIDNSVEFAFTLGGLDARPCDGLNGGPTQVNQRDVFAIEGLIIGVDTRPLGTVGVVRG